MKKLAIALLILLPSGGFCQQAKVLKDKGLKKLDVFLGTWRAETAKGSGATAVSALSTCRWSANGQYLIADQMVNNGGKKTNNLAIYSYNPANDDYTLSLVGVPGTAPFTIGITYMGDELIYSSNYTANGQKTYIRTLNMFNSPSDYIFKVQSSKDSITWVTSVEGRSVKISK